MAEQTKPSDGKSTVYMATNVITGKRYIGITIRYLSKRKADHGASAKAGAPTFFARAIRKYGIENFKFEALARLDKYDDAKAMEIFLISSMRPEYNQTGGGDGYLGYIPSEEAKRKIRAANIGRPGYWKGKKLPAHVMEAARTAMASHPDRLKILAMGPLSIRRKVVCLNDGIIYDSCKDAGIAYGVSRGSVSSICGKKTGRKTVKGLIFRYAEETHGGMDEAKQVLSKIKEKRIKQIEAIRPMRKRFKEAGNGVATTS